MASFEKKTGGPLQVIVVEDSEDDTMLVLREIRKGGYEPVFERVETAEELRDALSSRKWGLVISDFSMPYFDAISAMKIVHERDPDLPFILVSGTITEETAVNAMKAGAQDFVTKGNMARLVPAIERELIDAQVRRERRRMEKELEAYHADLEKKVEERTRELAQANAQLLIEIAERKRIEEEIRHMAHHDSLTGLPNRRLFADILKIEIAQARRHKSKLAVLFLDLDRFKDINDTLGHETGDLLLREVADRFRKTVRESDTVARIGGDEFNIVMADISRTGDIGDFAQKIIDSLRKPVMINGNELNITTSIGISVYPDDGDEIDALRKYADIAMYHAKESGRNTYQFYNPAINIRSVERMRLESMLLRSVELGELVVYYQPLINISTRRIECAEALVRWRHSEKGLLLPENFIQTAEESGFINAIDEWVLRTVGKQARSWLDTRLPPVCITVNLSSRQFRNPELAGKIGSILRETGMPPERLDIEVSESMAMANVERSAARMRELSAMGIHISIDDFGTGYSSLNHLKRLPIERLKIDRSFIQDISFDSDDRAIVSAVVQMGHMMKLKVVAEGVETNEQFAFLSKLNCDEAQGFLFNRPLPPGEFAELLAASLPGGQENRA